MAATNVHIYVASSIHTTPMAQFKIEMILVV